MLLLVIVMCDNATSAFVSSIVLVAILRPRHRIDLTA